jgi:transposase
MRVWRMRTGISISLKPADRRRLAALARDRNAPHKHVWRAGIVLLSADGVGTNEIMRQTGKSKTCVWRWQERFMLEGYDGLLRDKTRPARIPPLGPDIAERIVALTRTDPPVEATHWTATMMAKAVGISASSVHASGARMAFSHTGSSNSSSPTIRSSSTSCAMLSGFMSIRPPMPSSSRSTKSRKSRRSTAPSPACR